MKSEYSEPKELGITIGQAYPAEVETTEISWKINVEKWKPAIRGAWFKFGQEYENKPYVYFESRPQLRALITQLAEFDIAWQVKEVEIQKKIEDENNAKADSAKF